MQGFHIGWVPFHHKNGEVVDKVIIPAMRCPSSEVPAAEMVGIYQVAMPSYTGIAGATSHDNFPEHRVSPCCSPKVDGEISSGGLLISNQVVRKQPNY